MRAQGEDRLQCRKGHGAGTRVLGQRIRIIYIGSANHVRITNFVLRRSYAQLRLSLASFLSSKRSTPALRAKCMGGAHRSIHVACKWDASCVVPKRNLNAQHTHSTRPPLRLDLPTAVRLVPCGGGATSVPRTTYVTFFTPHVMRPDSVTAATA